MRRAGRRAGSGVAERPFRRWLRTTLALATFGSLAAWAQPFAPPPFAPPRFVLPSLDLPTAVGEEALSAAARAVEQPAVRAEIARVGRAVDAARAPALPEWSLGPGLSVAWDGSVSADVGVGVRLPIVNPSRDRDRRDAASASRRSRLELELRARQAAQDAIEARLALWRLSRQLRLAERARTVQDAVQDAVPRGQADRASRLARLGPDLRFEQERLRARVARAAGLERLPAVPDQAWTGLLRRTPRTCPDGSMNVRLAAEALRAAVERERSALASVPTVTIGASTDLHLRGVPHGEGSRPTTELEAGLWIGVGLPSGSQAAGTVEARADLHGVSVRLNVRGDPDAPGSEAYSVEVARAELDEARYLAHERTGQALHELASARARLAALDGRPPPTATLDRLERGWEAADLEARVAAILVHLALDCARGGEER